MLLTKVRRLTGDFALVCDMLRVLVVFGSFVNLYAGGLKIFPLVAFGSRDQ